ncbi:MAG: hypothetical protein Q8P30_03025 [Candidatus Uhrbacteria bacterium]|nr:hypothetical protein [Candidatus Uhrbacteria bacterium]
MRTLHQKVTIWHWAGLFFLVIFILSILANTWQSQFKADVPEIGVTFSNVYAMEILDDWKGAYSKMLNDLGVKSLRLPVYWSQIESTEGVYSFDDLDWMMEEAVLHNVNVTLVVGVKVPRWPECFIPDWAEGYEKDYLRAEATRFVRDVVLRYRTNTALERWQIENESLFYFGECPLPDLLRIEEETELVRSLDKDNEIQLTTSGEQGFWAFRASFAEVIGASLYRVVWNEIFGYIVFPYRPELYSLQRLVTSTLTDKVVIAELQAEPWLHKDTGLGDTEALYAAFTAEDLFENVKFAKRTGTDEIFLWGVEWWYYLLEQGDDRLWNAAREVFSEN